MKSYVIDASSIFMRKAVYGNMVTVPEVAEEVRDEDSKLYMSLKNIRIEEANQNSVEVVRKVAMRTGDIYRLSDADLKLIAKAVDEMNLGKEAVIVTDDYSIQNVAKHLGIGIERVVQRGITREFRWVRVCRGCRRIIETEKCDVCGSEAVLRRFRK